MPTAADLGFFDADACRIDRTVLRDPALQAELEERGYVVVPLLDPAEVAELVAGYDELGAQVGGHNPPGAYNDTYAEFSIMHSKPEFRRAAYDLMDRVLTPAADRFLIDHRPLIANFVNKPPGTGVVPVHQNFSVVDERTHRSVSVWVALVDCVSENGAMSMLDGSQRTLRGRRGMWAYQAWSGLDQQYIDGCLTPVEVPAGHAVILDDAVLHYSPPNATDHRRLAIQFVMVPAEIPPLWFQQVGETGDLLDIAVWEIDEGYFFDFWHGDGDEAHAVERERVSVAAPPLDRSMLEHLMEQPDHLAIASDPAASGSRQVAGGVRRRLASLFSRPA